MKKLQHPHVVRLLEVMDDHLLKEIYLGKHHVFCVVPQFWWPPSGRRSHSTCSAHILRSSCDLNLIHSHTPSLVMEYCSGGEIKWRTSNQKPTLRVSQTRRIIRDVILGLEYRACFTVVLLRIYRRPACSSLPGHHTPRHQTSKPLVVRRPSHGQDWRFRCLTFLHGAADSCGGPSSRYNERGSYTHGRRGPLKVCRHGYVPCS